jgi:transposase
MARLRHDTFFSLADLNRRIQELLRELNDRSMAHLGQSRRELFEAIDLPALNPLPQKPYEFAQTKIARVSIDYQVEYDKHFYSVPNRLIHEEVRLRVTEHLVEIYHKSQRDPAAVHPRSYATGRHTTCKEHMPLNHQRRQEWSPERFLKWAEQVGPNAKKLIQTALARRKHPEQAYRTCLGILNLSKKHSPERLDEACRQALAAKVFAYGDVKDILDQLPSADPALSSTPTHPNLRGGGYYQ